MGADILPGIAHVASGGLSVTFGIGVAAKNVVVVDKVHDIGIVLIRADLITKRIAL